MGHEGVALHQKVRVQRQPVCNIWPQFWTPGVGLYTSTEHTLETLELWQTKARNGSWTLRTGADPVEICLLESVGIGWGLGVGWRHPTDPKPLPADQQLTVINTN